MPKALADKPECPMELRYVWDWYIDLHGKNELTYLEINSWAVLNGIKPNGSETKMLMSLDRIRSDG